MSTRSPAVRLLRGFLRVALDSDLSPSEYREAARELRNGRVVDTLADFLESLGQIDSNPVERDRLNRPPPQAKRGHTPGIPAVDDLFNTIKRRKIAKRSLLQMLGLINSEAMRGVDDELPIRDVLRAFRKRGTDADWQLLTDMVSGDAEIDPFLQGILKR